MLTEIELNQISYFQRKQGNDPLTTLWLLLNSLFHLSSYPSSLAQNDMEGMDGKRKDILLLCICVHFYHYHRHASHDDGESETFESLMHC